MRGDRVVEFKLTNFTSMEGGGTKIRPSSRIYCSIGERAKPDFRELFEKEKA